MISRRILSVILPGLWPYLDFSFIRPSNRSPMFLSRAFFSQLSLLVLILVLVHCIGHTMISSARFITLVSIFNIHRHLAIYSNCTSANYLMNDTHIRLNLDGYKEGASKSPILFQVRLRSIVTTNTTVHQKEVKDLGYSTSSASRGHSTTSADVISF